MFKITEFFITRLVAGLCVRVVSTIGCDYCYGNRVKVRQVRVDHCYGNRVKVRQVRVDHCYGNRVKVRQV
jgi:ethanolamine ammonia-lyase large subunit